METKTLPIGFELKAVTGRTIEGYAAAWARDRVNDIIDPKAFNRTVAENPDVAIFVGHDSTKLPVGHPIEMRADSHGLFTKSHIYDTPDGNALLTVARERLAKGRTLGMSIGFRTVKDHWDAKQKARILEDVDLIEYSFLASPLLAANPQAVALGVKATSLVEESYEDLQGDLSAACTAALGGSYCCVVATYPTHAIVMAMSPGDPDGEYWDFPYTLGPDMEPTLGDPKPVQRAFVDAAAEARGKAFREKAALSIKVSADSAVAQAAKGGPLMELKDSAFAYVELGGVLDTEQKTVPRSARHVPHHHEDGTVDLDVVRAFLEAPGDEAKALPHMMQHAWEEGLFGLKSRSGREPQPGGAGDVYLEIAYRALMLRNSTADDAWAMHRQNLDTKDGVRLWAGAQAETKLLGDLAYQLVKRAEEIDRGEDGAVLANTWRTAFELLDLEEVA